MFSQPRRLKMLSAAILAASLFPLANLANAQVYYTPGSYQAAPPVQVGVPQNGPQLSDDQIDALTAPIALYPDPLLAQLLPASTYPNDIAAAAAYVTQYGQPDEATIDKQPWDPSVKALVHYPAVLEYMGTNIQWTEALGAAFMNQPQDVMNSIQRLRAEAITDGSLASNQEQQVVNGANGIEILPANPQVIYVPTYDSNLVYLRECPLNFGRGLVFGTWLNFGFDWGHHAVLRDYDWAHRNNRRPEDLHPWVRDNRRPAPVYPQHYGNRGAAVGPGYEKTRPEAGRAFDANEKPAQIQRESNRGRTEIVHPAVPARPAPHPAAAPHPEPHPAAAPHPEPHPTPAPRPEPHPTPAPRPEPRPAPAPRPAERPTERPAERAAPAPHAEAPRAEPQRAAPSAPAFNPGSGGNAADSARGHQSMHR